VGKSKVLNKRELNKIRKRLPVGWKGELSVQSGLSVSLVEKVLYGVRNNEQIVLKALTLSNLTPEDKSKIKEIIDHNISQY
jgi:hypothetical protein